MRKSIDSKTSVQKCFKPWLNLPFAITERFSYLYFVTRTWSAWNLTCRITVRIFRCMPTYQALIQRNRVMSPKILSYKLYLLLFAEFIFKWTFLHFRSMLARGVSPTPSQMSMKSDRSMDLPGNFQGGITKDMTRYLCWTAYYNAMHGISLNGNYVDYLTLC